MPALLVVHLGDAAIDREAVAGLVGVLRRQGHRVVSWAERAGVGGGLLGELERSADAADHILLVDPLAWWTRGPTVDALERALRERLEHCLANAIEQFVVIHDARREGTKLGNLLGAVPAFVLPRAWPELLDRLARPREHPKAPIATMGSLRRPRPWIDRPELDAAIDQAIATEPNQPGRTIWIRGGIGTGKTCLLLALLARREAAGLASVVHVARPGLAATHEPPELQSGLERPTLIVIDGIELIVDPIGLDPERSAARRRFAAFLAGPLPAGVTVVVASRPLAPGLLDPLAPAIDLDTPRWAAAQAALVEAILASAKPGADVDALRELASRNPAAARALLDSSVAPSDELDVPPRFAALLERAYGRLRELPADDRRELLAGLALVCAGLAPLPERLLDAALGSGCTALLERHAAEWLRRDDGRLALAHPFMAGFLATELGPERIDPHLALLSAGAALRSRAQLDEASDEYLRLHAEAHRQAARGLSSFERQLRELPRLVRAVGDGTLEALLERGLAAARPDHAPLIGAMLEIARQELHRIEADPAALPSVLWDRLVARGFGPSALEAELTWADTRPRIRLTNAQTRIDRCERILRGHIERIEGCGISADASLAITVGNDQTLRIWEPLAGRELECMDLGGWVEACALTPDGARAVANAGAKVLLIDPRGASTIAEHDEHRASVTALAISPDGNHVLSGDRDGHVVIWDVAAGRRTSSKAHGDRVNVCAIAKTGLGATGGSDKQLCIWSLEHGVRRHSLVAHSYAVSGLAFTHDGAWLVSICIGEARVWDPETGREVDCYEDLGQSCAGAVIVGEPAQVVAAESGERISRWTFDDGELCSRVYAHPVDMTCIAATPDGEWILTGGNDNVARLWRSERNKPGEDPELTPLVLPISSLLPGEAPGTIWVGGGGRGTRLIHLGDPDNPLVELADRPSPYALACVEEVVYAVGTDRRVTSYSATRGAKLSHWEASSDWLRAIAVDDVRSQLACAGDDGRIRVLAIPLADKPLLDLGGHTDWIHALAFRRDGQLVAIDADGCIKVWDLLMEAAVLELRSSKNACLYGLTLDAGTGLAVVTGIAGMIEVHDLDSGALVRSFTGHRGPVHAVALTPDDRVLASAGRDGTLRFWSFADATLLASHDTGVPLTHVAIVGEHVVVGTVPGDVMIFAVDWSTMRP